VDFSEGQTKSVWVARSFPHFRLLTIRDWGHGKPDSSAYGLHELVHGFRKKFIRANENAHRSPASGRFGSFTRISEREFEICLDRAPATRTAHVGGSASVGFGTECVHDRCTSGGRLLAVDSLSYVVMEWRRQMVDCIRHACGSWLSGALSAFLRKEGIRLRDLIGRVRLHWGHDLFLGAGVFLLVFPFFMLAAPVVTRLLYGATPLPAFAGLAAGRVLPRWAVIYSFSIWLLIWSPTEEITYQGYALSRLEVLFGRRWKAIALASFWWAIQHPFLPFIVDWRYFTWRFLMFLPSMVVLTLLYLKIRRLPPFFLAHWAMDTIALFMTLKLRLFDFRYRAAGSRAQGKVRPLFTPPIRQIPFLPDRIEVTSHWGIYP